MLFRLREQKPVIAWSALASAGRHKQPVVHIESSAVAAAGYFWTAGFGVFAKSKVQQALPRKGFLEKHGMKASIKVWMGFGREEAWSLFWAEKYFLLICTYEKNVFHVTRCCLRSVAKSKARFPLERQETYKHKPVPLFSTSSSKITHLSYTRLPAHHHRLSHFRHLGSNPEARKLHNAILSSGFPVLFVPF